MTISGNKDWKSKREINNDTDLPQEKIKISSKVTLYLKELEKKNSKQNPK